MVGTCRKKIYENAMVRATLKVQQGPETVRGVAINFGCKWEFFVGSSDLVRPRCYQGGIVITGLLVYSVVTISAMVCLCMLVNCAATAMVCPVTPTRGLAVSGSRSSSSDTRG